MINKLKFPKTLPIVGVAFLMALSFLGGQHSFAQSSTDMAKGAMDIPAESNNNYKDTIKPAKKI